MKKFLLKAITSISLCLVSMCSYSYDAYNAINLNVGDSVGFSYDRNMDQRRINVSANGIIGFTDDNQFYAPAARYNIIPINDQAFLDNFYVDLAGIYARLKKEENDNSTVTAIAFGGGARMKILDEYSFLRKPLFLAGSINYAPPGMTYRDGTNFLGWMTRLEYPIFGRSLGYVGFRSLTSDLEKSGFKKENAKIDQTAFIGLQFVF